MLPASVCGGVSRGLMYRCATLSPTIRCREKSSAAVTSLCSYDNLKHDQQYQRVLITPRKTSSPEIHLDWITGGTFTGKHRHLSMNDVFFMHIGQINHIYTKQICILYRQVQPTSLDSVFYHMPVVVTTQTFQALTVKAVNFTPSNNNNHKHVTREKIQPQLTCRSWIWNCLSHTVCKVNIKSLQVSVLIGF